MIPWQLALIAWPVVAVVFYRRLSLPAALTLTILGGYLLLPTRYGVDLPILPELNKTTIPVLSALILTIVTLQKGPTDTLVLPGWIPREPVSVGLMLMLVLGAFGTFATNTDTLVYGPRVLQALSVYDAFSMVLELLLLMVPFLLGRKVLASREAQAALLYILTFAALVYTVPTLVEVRLSPQINTWIYGFFPHSFAQHMRGDGFRPVVFLNHGLALSLFFTFSVLAARGIMRLSKPQDRLKWAVAAAWLFATMFLTKSLGPLMITVVLIPVLLFLSIRLQLLAVAGIAVIMLTYPMLRAAHLIPVDEVMSFVEDFNPARAASLNTRVENEEILLEKAQQRPVFGWGVWGRQRVFDSEGRNLSITDGTWIIELGAGGWVRYIGILGLLCWPVIALLFARREKIDLVCVTLAIILSAKLVDLIPNSGIPGINWLMAGALIGRLEMRQSTSDEVPLTEKVLMRPGYTRGRQLSAPVARPEGPRYARSFPEKEARRAKTEADARTSRPAVAYKRPGADTGYHR